MIYLIAPGLSWLIAQGLKHLFRLMGRNRRIFGGHPQSKFLLSGGMPSAHSAVVVSLALYIGLYEGWSSPFFALSLVFAAVVVYDSIMVRYSSGQQGDILNSLLKKQKSKHWPLRVAHGHTPIEALAGSLIGIAVALVVFFTTN